MCGIVSLFGYHHAAPRVEREELLAIRDAMVHRGPDGCGEWISDNTNVALAHRRLAIIDLDDRALQPMKSDDGRYVISYNGEIYNYAELKAGLEKEGVRFRTTSDTEVLLQLYKKKGEAMVNDLRGMFAIALWDSKKQELVLIRDPYGIKPLYYADDGWTVRVASEVKALLKSPKVSKTKEPAGVVSFFLQGFVQEPFTYYQQIRALPAGSILKFSRVGAHPVHCYASITQIFKDSVEKSQSSSAEIEEQVHEALRESLRYHMVSDVEVGLFLSAGIDSGSLLGLAHDLNPSGIRTTTLGFDEFKGQVRDESALAKEVAEYYQAEHYLGTISQSQFEGELNQALGSMDQPTIDGLNTYWISKIMAERGIKVALSGLGGDELFGGYSTFSEIPAAAPLLKIPSHVPGLGDFIQTILMNLNRDGSNRWRKMAGSIKFGKSTESLYFLKRSLFSPCELEQILDKDIVREGLRRLSIIRRYEDVLTPDPKESYARVAALESSVFMRNQLLVDSDWASMAHSVELRTPLVDYQLLRSTAPALAARKEKIGKQWLINAPTKKLPISIQRKKKTGFTLPMHSWLLNSARGNEWREIPLLNQKNCHWARRWAYSVHQSWESKP